MIPFANVGFPLFIPVFAGIGIMALPLLVLETLVARRVFRESWRVCFFTVLGANLISTVLGIPLATIAVFIGGTLVGAMGHQVLPSNLQGPLAAAIVYPAWLPPLDNYRPWHVCLSVLMLLTVFFFASVWIEAYMARRILPEDAVPRARRWAWVANGWSYSIMFVAAVAEIGLHWTWE